MNMIFLLCEEWKVKVVLLALKKSLGGGERIFSLSPLVKWFELIGNHKSRG